MSNETTKTRNATAQTLWGIFLLFCGISIYLLFRSKTITIYRWCETIGATGIIDNLRHCVRHWAVPDFVRYSLPDGLYCASYILIMDAIWRKGRKKARIVAVSLIPLAAIVHETLQGLGLARGTFDFGDFLCYTVPLVTYLILSRNSN